MSAPDDLERRLRRHFAASATMREPEALFDAVMRGTGRARQRPRLIAGGFGSPVRLRAPALLPPVPAVIVIALVAVLVGGVLLAAAIAGGMRLGDLITPDRRGPVTGEQDLGWVIYERPPEQGGGLFLMRSDGSDDHPVPGTGAGQATQPDWSPDGSRIAFVSEGGDAITVMGIDGSGRIDMACAGGGCRNPSWSPDGTKIAFSHVFGGDASPSSVSLEVMDLATREVALVTNLLRPVLPDAPRWSPDGSQLVFAADMLLADGTESGSAIGVVPSSGGSPRYATGFESFTTEPDWGPAGIVFAVRAPPTRPLPADLFLVQPDGSGLRNLTNLAPGEGLRHPAWGSSGDEVLAVDAQTGRVVSVDLDTGTRTVVGSETAAVARPRPQP